MLLDLNSHPVFLSITVSIDPPIALANIGFSIAWASMLTLPKASGSIDAETTKLAKAYARAIFFKGLTSLTLSTSL